MQKSDLENVIEGILFVAGSGVEIKDIAEKLEMKESVVKEAIESLKRQYTDKGINIITFKNKVQMCSNPKFAEDIAGVLNPIKEKQLSKATLETVAVIAYKQPVTRLEIEQVRGVNCDYALQVLMNFHLVEVIGRKDVLGKPLLFGTTDEFLKRFQIEDVSQLPDYDSLLERIKLIHADDKEDDSLYNNFKLPDEEDQEFEKAMPRNNLEDEQLFADNISSEE